MGLIKSSPTASFHSQHNTRQNLIQIPLWFNPYNLVCLCGSDSSKTLMTHPFAFLINFLVRLFLRLILSHRNAVLFVLCVCRFQDSLQGVVNLLTRRSCVFLWSMGEIYIRS